MLLTLLIYSLSCKFLLLIKQLLSKYLSLYNSVIGQIAEIYQEQKKRLRISIDAFGETKFIFVTVD